MGLRFLDRFVFRNPKQISAKQTKGPAQRRVMGKRNIYTPIGVRALAVDSKEFIKQSKTSIPVDEMFLYQYFQRRSSKKGQSKVDDKDDKDDMDSDMESIASEDFEQYIADHTDLDFASAIKPKTKAEKAKKKKEADDEEDDEAGSESDLEAAEMDSDDDYDKDKDFQDAFKDFDEMLNDKSIPDLSNENEEDDDEEGEADDEDEDENDHDEDADESGDDDDDDEPGFREEEVDFSDAEEEADTKVAVPAKSGKLKSKKRPVEDDMDDDLDWAFGSKPSSKKRSRNLFADTGSDFVGAEEFSAMLEANAVPGMKNAGTSEALANKDKASVKQLAWETSRHQWMTDKNRPRKGTQRQKKKGANKTKSGPAFRRNKAKRAANK